MSWPSSPLLHVYPEPIPELHHVMSPSVNQYGAPRAQALLVELVRLEARPARFLGIN
jgi:hypothetical protein